MGYQGAVAKHISVADTEVARVFFGPFSPGDVIDGVQIAVHDPAFGALSSELEWAVSLFESINEPVIDGTGNPQAAAWAEGRQITEGLPSTVFTTPVLTSAMPAGFDSVSGLRMNELIKDGTKWLGVFIGNDGGIDFRGSVSISVDSPVAISGRVRMATRASVLGVPSEGESSGSSSRPSGSSSSP